MHHMQQVVITAPDDEIVPRYDVEHGIATLTFRDANAPYGASAQILVHPTLLTREQQAAWLRRLRDAAAELADAVERQP